jgi:hypothetical protein
VNKEGDAQNGCEMEIKMDHQSNVTNNLSTSANDFVM